MTAYDFVQLALLAHGREVRGKTKLQKTVYFLGVLTGEQDNLGYRPHYYGPYSAAVAEAVDDLRALGFLDQTVATFGNIDSSGFEVARQDLKLNVDGVSVAKEKAKKHPEMLRKMKSVFEKHARVFSQNYEKLSIAAKTYFLLGEKKGSARVGELSTLAAKFGWSVEPNQIREVIRKILEPLDLVSLKE
jgi:uncharacterized protein YwgA